jgi:hypothetical protein
MKSCLVSDSVIDQRLLVNFVANRGWISDSHGLRNVSGTTINQYGIYPQMNVMSGLFGVNSPKPNP